MNRQNKPKIVVIVGPTASGKTSLSIEIAKRFDGEVISADSRQIYKGLDIGSGKVTEEETDGVPHHLLDIADPKDIYNVTDFVRDGRAAIADIFQRGKLPIVTGGSFFYVDALLGRVSTPEVPPNPAFRESLSGKSNEKLFTLLEEQDSRRAADIDKDNPVRLIRALEIVDAIGRVPESVQEELYEAFIIGIDIEKEKLHENIHTRLYTRLEDGMVEEVENLHDNGLSYERLESLGLEYRYIAQFLQKKISREEMCEKLETEIRRFAKRQMTWLKRDKSIHWFKKGNDTVLDSIQDFIDI